MADTGSTHPYRGVLAASERAAWQLDDVFPEGTALDFSCDFLPEALGRTAGLSFLRPGERRRLNQVRGHTYLAIFGLVEEFILPFVLDHVRSVLGQRDDLRTRALLGFASEEAKHIQLFQRFRASFVAGFGHPCEVIGPPEAIARAVLGRGPLGVGLAILHIEWMTQRHYVDSVKGAPSLEANFARLLEKHWVEEAQHARIDALVVRHLARHLDPAEIEASVDDYLAIVELLDDGLRDQAELDLRAFELAIGRSVTPAEKDRLRAVQRAANRETYLVSGMTHPRFLAVLDAISPGGAARVRAATATYAV